jgi:hypothetical protein
LVMAPIAAMYWQIFMPGEYYEKLKKRYSLWAFAMHHEGTPKWFRGWFRHPRLQWGEWKLPFAVAVPGNDEASRRSAARTLWG